MTRGHTSSLLSTYAWSDLKEVSKVAHGTTTTIYKAILHGTPVAAKVLSTALPREGYAIAAKDLRNEVELNQRLRHPHIVLFLGVVIPPRQTDPPGLLFEYAERRLKCADYGPGRIRDGIAVALAVARALAFVHALGLMHRDVKPSQVLFCGAVAKLGDWGLGRFVGEGMTGETGTWEFMAPEVLRNEEYDEKADVYSFGMLVFAIVNGLDYPFEREFLTPAQAAVGVVGGLRPKWSSRVGEGIRKIVEECWRGGGGERPCMAVVVDKLVEIEEVKEEKDKGWASWLWG